MADAKTTALTDLPDVAVDDILPIVDDVAGTPITKKVTVENLLEALNVLTAEASIDGAADFLLVYDTSATGVRKVLPDNLPVANHAASKITSGTLAHERGGLEADVSAYDGLLRITAGATSAVTVTSFALTVLDDSDAATVRATIGAASSAEVAAILSGYARRQGVIARVDNTAAPPTEVSGDRYLLDATGASHANWDGAAANDIVEFDGASWVATTPTEGWIVYSDGSDTDWLFIDDGSPGWTERTAGGGVTDHGALTGLSDDDHTIYSLADGSRWTTTQTINRAVMTDGSGNLVVSTVTATELGYVSGVTSGVQGQIDGKAATSHNHAASDINSGTLAHERGGIEADISAVAIGDILAGTGTGTMALVTATGHSDGDVLTIQADGTVDFETPSGGSGGSGGLTITAKTAGYTAANGDLVVCDANSGAFNITLPAAPTLNDRIGIYLEHGSFTLAVTVQGNGKTLAEFGTAVTLNTPGDVIIVQYDGTKWVIESNGIQTYSLGLLSASAIDEDDDGVRLYDGSATEDFEKRATVKSMLAPYVEDSTLGTAAGDIIYRPTANTHWVNLPAGTDAGLGGVPNYPVASQAEAEAGTATNRLMNPLRTAQAIAALESGGGDTLPVVDTTGIAKGSADATKIVRLEVDGLTTATTRVLTVQDADGTIALTGPIADGQAHFKNSSDATKEVTIDCSGVKTGFTISLKPDAPLVNADRTFRVVNTAYESAAPTASSDRDFAYSAGSTWLDYTNQVCYVCILPNDNAAVWQQVQLNGGLKTLTDGATVTVDAQFGATQRVTLAGNRTIAFSNFKTGQKVCLRLTQDGTGSRTVTWPSSGVTINWAGGSAPTLTTTASKADWIVLVCTDATGGAEVYDAWVEAANL